MGNQFHGSIDAKLVQVNFNLFFLRGYTSDFRKEDRKRKPSSYSLQPRSFIRQFVVFRKRHKHIERAKLVQVNFILFFLRGYTSDFRKEDRKRKPPAKLRDDPGHGRRGIQDGHPPHVLDALKLITTSWDNITKKAIIRCWLKANILSENQTGKMEGLVGNDNSWVGAGLPGDEIKCLKSKISTICGS